MKVFLLLSEYRWPIYLGGHLAMSVVACAVLVWVATRPDAPRPIQGYYQAAERWDADEAAQDVSRQLGWTVRYALPDNVPYYPGMPRPVDVTVADRDGRPVDGLSGQLLAIRPADARLTQRGAIVALPSAPGSYRTLVRLDGAGTWEFRLDTRQQALHFVHRVRVDISKVPGVVSVVHSVPGGPGDPAAAPDSTRGIGR